MCGLVEPSRSTTYPARSPPAAQPAMAQCGRAPQEPISSLPIRPAAAVSAPIQPSAADSRNPSLWRRLLGRAGNGASGPQSAPEAEVGPAPALDEKTDAPDPDDPRLVPPRKFNRPVIPGLPRTQTFKRQQSELRDNLMPAELSADERRALSTDRRLHSPPWNGSESQSNPRSSAPDVLFGAVTAVSNGGFASTTGHHDVPSAPSPSLASGTLDGRVQDHHDPRVSAEALDSYLLQPHLDSRPGSRPEPRAPALDTASMTTSQYDQLIHDDLERIWILNLSMHFRDRSKREKFFITYRQTEHCWRRVTISLDYRNAPENSLELDLEHTKFQREKNAKIYEAIRESLQDIQFYDTVTNLKLQTTEGRLHVHVVEDVNEIIQYPTLRMVNHLRCRRVREREIHFDSHMSGFVYKVNVHGQTLIKKEIPGPDTVDEFLYEINALTQLRDSRHVIELYGVIIDDEEEHVKGLLISYAEQGALIDMIYDNDHSLPWHRREKWARQIVSGLSEIHEAGFVQGDFTLSNIVIDQNDDAKIIDINRRGCPVGWEPPEATPLIDSGQRISMYIGVKSDLFQLGMVLWAIATQEDEPEAHDRPLRIVPEVDCPRWFRTLVDTCLSENPRLRMSASSLETMFPGYGEGAQDGPIRNGERQPYPRGGHAPSASVDSSVHVYGPPIIRTINSPPPEWSYKTFGHTYVDPPTGMSNEPYYFPMRGRSPPSPIASHRGGFGGVRGRYTGMPVWSAYSYDQSRSDRSVSDELDVETGPLEAGRSVTPRTNNESISAPEPAEKELALVGAPLVVSADGLSEVPDLEEPQDQTPHAEMRAATDVLSQLTVVGDAEPMGYKCGSEMRAAGIPLPPSPVEDGEVREDEPATSESGGASLQWNENEGEGDNRVTRIWLPEEAQWEAGITEPEAHGAPVAEPFPTLATTEPALPPEAGPTTEQAPASATEPLVDRMKTPSTGRWLAVGTESLHGDGASILEADPAANTASMVDNQSTPRPGGYGTPLGAASARASPIRELPDELKGIGSAHDHANEEAMRTQGSILDDLRALTNSPGQEDADEFHDATASILIPMTVE